MPEPDLERLTLDGVELNDAVIFDTLALVFTPAAKKPIWASSGNTDGAALVPGVKGDNAIFDLTVQVVPEEATDAALAKLGELRDKLQACERFQGGIPLEWQPNQSTRTYTYWALLAEETGMPVQTAGDETGWFGDAPILHIKITCRPYAIVEELEALALTESPAAPHHTVYVQVSGDVPAEAELIAVEGSAVDRRHFRFGQDLVESDEGNPPDLITASDIVTAGYSGVPGKREGAYGSEDVISAKAVSQATVLGATGPLAHIGSYRVLGRLETNSEDLRYRISFRSGDGPWIALEWQAPPVVADYSAIDFGEVSFDEAINGEQASEIRLEHRTVAEVTTTYFNYFEFYPTGVGYGKARGIALNSPTELLAYDTFEQGEANLTGENLPLGGKWGGDGDKDDFKVVVAEDGQLQRTAMSDADLASGRFAIAGSKEPATTQVSVDTRGPGVGPISLEVVRRGVFARYADPENWIMAVLANRLLSLQVNLVVVKCVEGEVTTVAEKQGVAPSDKAWLTVALRVSADGTWSADAYPSGNSSPFPLLEGQEPVLSAGGALAEGQSGIYDALTLGEERPRHYDSFNLLAADPPGRVCFAGRTCRLNNDGFIREDPDGEVDGRPSIYRGADFYLEPKGDSNAFNRVVLALRRNDIDVAADSHVTDKHNVQILKRERYLAPR